MILLTTDVVMDIGIHGIPLFPALAFYGNGLFMHMGISIQFALVLLNSLTFPQFFF